ncbi:MAG: hypothetical protein N4A47_06530 [Clostridia bacterium]|jgi:hypothetical protein|nr:hypothetical protein [Clostridia bacterium]
MKKIVVGLLMMFLVLNMKSYAKITSVTGSLFKYDEEQYAIDDNGSIYGFKHGLKDEFTEIDDLGSKTDKAIDASKTSFGTVIAYENGKVWSTYDDPSKKMKLDTRISGVKKLYSARRYTLLHKNDNTLWAIGYSSSGEFGLGIDYKNTSNYIKINSNVKSVSIADNSVVVVKTDGTLWHTGKNAYVGNSNVFKKISGISGVESVVHHDYNTYEYILALKADGTLWAKGKNRNGEFGTGNKTAINTFTQIATNVKGMFSSKNHGGVVIWKTDNKLYSSGSNVSTVFQEHTNAPSGIEKVYMLNIGLTMLDNKGDIYYNPYGISYVTPTKVKVKKSLGGKNYKTLLAGSNEQFFLAPNGEIHKYINGTLYEKNYDNYVHPSKMEVYDSNGNYKRSYGFTIEHKNSTWYDYSDTSKILWASPDNTRYTYFEIYDSGDTADPNMTVFFDIRWNGTNFYVSGTPWEYRDDEVGGGGFHYYDGSGTFWDGQKGCYVRGVEYRAYGNYVRFIWLNERMYPVSTGAKMMFNSTGAGHTRTRILFTRAGHIHLSETYNSTYSSIFTTSDPPWNYGGDSLADKLKYYSNGSSITGGGSFPRDSFKRVSDTHPDIYAATSGLSDYYTYKNGNFYSTKRVILLSNQPPTAPTVTAPAEGAKTKVNTVAINWNFNDPDSGDAQTKYRVQGSTNNFSSVQYDTGVVTSSAKTKTTTLLADGAWKFRVMTWDSKGAVSPWSAHRSFRVDTTPPVMTYGYVSGARYINGSDYWAKQNDSLSFWVQGVDSGSGMYRSFLYTSGVTGSPYRGHYNTNAGTNYNTHSHVGFTGSTTNVNNGSTLKATYTFKVITASNITANIMAITDDATSPYNRTYRTWKDTGYNLKTDNTKPTSPVITVNSSWTKNNVSFTVTGGSDSLSGLARREYKIGNGSWTTYSSPVTISQAGITTIFARTVDNVGNISDSVNRLINIDKTKPSGTFTLNSSGWTKNNISVTFNPSDSGGSNVYRWRFRTSIDNGSTYRGWGSYINGNTNSVIPLETEGLRKIQAEVTDNAGNVQIMTSGTYQIDKTLPTYISSSISGATYVNGNIYWIKKNETLKIRLRGADNLAGIIRTYIKLPGSEDVRAYHNWLGDATNIVEFDTSTYATFTGVSETYESGMIKEAEFTLKGLKMMPENGVYYYFRDHANNNYGYGNTGLKVAVDDSLPVASAAVTVNSSTSLTVTVTASDTGSGIKDYSFDGGATWQSGNSKTFNSLTPNTQYTYNIRVRDNTLNVRSLSLSQYTNANVPSSFGATNGNTAKSLKINVSWNNNYNSAGTVYELEVSDNGTSGWINLYTGTNQVYAQTGLVDDTGGSPNPSVVKYYRIRSKSHNGNYTGYTSTISGNTLATPITTLEEYSSKGLGTGKTRVRINWNTVTGAKAYGLYIFDGYGYRFINLGNVLSFDSDVLRFFPTKAQIAAWDGTSDIFKRDGSGDFIDSSWNDLYVKANGGEVYNKHSYYAWIHLVSLDDEGSSSAGVWHGANHIDVASIFDNDYANEGTVNLVDKDTKSIIVSASATDKYMTDNYSGSGVKDYKFLNVEKAIESSYTQEHEFEDLLSNKRYNIKVKVRDNNLNENEYSSAFEFVTMPEKPENISIYSVFGNEMYIRVTPSSKNETVPELKVIAQNMDVLSNKIESTYTDEEIVKLEGFTPGANYKVTYKMRNLDLEETEEVLIDEILFIKKDTPTVIDEFEVNYGDLKTTHDEVDAKLVVTDNMVSKNDLRVKFIINGNGYGYDFDEGKWKSDHIGKYSKYYGGIPLEKDGENKIEVNVYDGVGNVSKEIRYVSKEKNGNNVVIIDKGNNGNTSSGNDQDGANIGGTINEGIVTAEGYILVKERNVKLELDVENVTEISYSSNGVRWSPWEKVTGNKVVKYVTLDNEPSELKTVYVKSKNEFGEGKKFKEILYKLDREGPKVKVSAANNINIAQNGEINLRLEMLDNVTKNIRYVVEISKDGENTRVIKGDSAGNESVIQKVVGLNNGFYNITLTAYDQLGNVGKNKLIILSK